MPDALTAPLRVLQVSARDSAGGAERIASDLAGSLRDRGHACWTAVGTRTGNDPFVSAIPGAKPRMLQPRTAIEGLGALGRALGSGLRALAHPLRGWDAFRGHEEFRSSPRSADILSLPPWRPRILHCHNLHGGYFDLRALPTLSASVPTFLTLHDSWLLSGHCAYAFDCQRWASGCGSCPYLSTYPAVRRDATAANWKRKRDILARCRLRIAAPSRWLMDMARSSLLAESMVEARVIPNGVDLAIFAHGDRNSARRELGLPLDRQIILFVANGIRANQFKDFATLRAALTMMVSDPRQAPLLVGLGEGTSSTADAATHGEDPAGILFVPYQHDRRIVAAYYRAADLYVHAALADTYPTTVIEALACGTPVVGTAVGGIPEQIRDGVTGMLVPPRDPKSLAEAVLALLHAPERLSGMAAAAVAHRAEHDLERMVGSYIDWYADALSGRA